MKLTRVSETGCVCVWGGKTKGTLRHNEASSTRNQQADLGNGAAACETEEK